MSNVSALYDAPDTPSAPTRPLVLAQVAAGFPSPADDHLDRDLDLHELLIQRPAATFDEAFLDLAGFEQWGLTEYARQIHATVRRDTNIPVSIAIAPTKMLAKIANHLAKAQPETGGVYELAEADVDDALAGIEVGEVWGIGPRWAAWLMRALDTLNTDYGARTIRIGNVSGSRPARGDAASLSQPALYDELAGVAGRTLGRCVTPHQAHRGCQEGSR